MRSFPYDWASLNRRQVSVSALLCLINQPDPNKNFLQLYSTSMTSQLNPYFGVDATNSMDYRFKSNHFVNGGGWYTQYLLSRLDGQFYFNVFGLIDRSADPDYSGEKTWIIDDDPDPAYHHFDVVHQKLDALSFSLNPEVFVISQDWITEDPNDVIGYVSHGVHAGMPWYYILSILQFNYANGANFLSWESFNCWSFGVEESGHGQLSHFIFKGGSGGSGTVYEPFTTGVTKEYNTLPAYAMGYSIVDANFQGIYLNAWQNCVVGDPLTTIAWGKQTTTKNISMTGTNLITDTITINTGDTLTFISGAHINLKHHGFVTGSGTLEVQSNIIVSSTDWQRALLLAAENDHPKLVWSVNPDMTPFTKYRIYRKIDTKPWKLIDSTTYQYYLDNTLIFSDPEGGIGKFVQYYVISVNNTSTSVPSNIVSGMFNKAQTGKIILPQTQVVENYNLSQNYPNPFNPSTVINYAIKEAGLVKIKVYDILGNEVAVLVNETKEAGYHSVKFNASKLPSGVYVYTLQAGSFSEVKKMILVK